LCRVTNLRLIFSLFIQEEKMCLLKFVDVTTEHVWFTDLNNTILVSSRYLKKVICFPFPNLK